MLITNYWLVSIHDEVFFNIVYHLPAVAGL